MSADVSTDNFFLVLFTQMCSIPCRLLFASAEGNSCAQLGVQWTVEFDCCHRLRLQFVLASSILASVIQYSIPLSSVSAGIESLSLSFRSKVCPILSFPFVQSIFGCVFRRRRCRRTTFSAYCSLNSVQFLVACYLLVLREIIVHNWVLH